MHFTPDMLPVKGRRFERSQQAIVFSKNVSRWCAVALALICVQLDISRFYLLCKVWLHMQAEPPREKVIITGSTEEMPFRPFQALWSNHRLKKSKWSWEWHTFIFFLCSCCWLEDGYSVSDGMWDTLVPERAFYVHGAHNSSVPTRVWLWQHIETRLISCVRCMKEGHQSNSVNSPWMYCMNHPRQLATCTLMKGRERRVKTTDFQLLTSVHSLSFGFLGPFGGLFLHLLLQNFRETKSQATIPVTRKTSTHKRATEHNGFVTVTASCVHGI